MNADLFIPNTSMSLTHFYKLYFVMMPTYSFIHPIHVHFYVAFINVLYIKKTIRLKKVFEEKLKKKDLIVFKFLLFLI